MSFLPSRHDLSAGAGAAEILKDQVRWLVEATGYDEIS